MSLHLNKASSALLLRLNEWSNALSLKVTEFILSELHSLLRSGEAKTCKAIIL
jgi:hypothetical protein